MEEQKIESVQTLFEKVAQLLTENLVAIYETKGTELRIRSVGGKTFRMTIEEI